MTSDCYAILGVNPAAEDVVIGAAYRALMRHYHPDTNPDPTAQARAREITAAYAVLRDPARRAAYDAQRADGDLWSPDDGDAGPPPRPPAMRAVGIAAAALALVLVAVAWNNRPQQPAVHSQLANLGSTQAVSTPAYPVVQLEPESERLARLRDEAEILSPVSPPHDEIAPSDPIVDPAEARPLTAGAAPAATPRRSANLGVGRHSPRRSPPNGSAAPAAATPRNQRLTVLDTMATGFFTQSMAHATEAKKELLLSARNRSAAKRKACTSDACVADAYVRQIRETSAIMEGRTGPLK